MQEWEVLLSDRLAPSFQEAERRPRLSGCKNKQKKREKKKDRLRGEKGQVSFTSGTRNLESTTSLLPLGPSHPPLVPWSGPEIIQLIYSPIYIRDKHILPLIISTSVDILSVINLHPAALTDDLSSLFPLTMTKVVEEHAARPSSAVSVCQRPKLWKSHLLATAAEKCVCVRTERARILLRFVHLFSVCVCVCVCVCVSTTATECKCRVNECVTAWTTERWRQWEIKWV